MSPRFVAAVRAKLGKKQLLSYFLFFCWDIVSIKAGSLGDIGDGDPHVPGEEVVALVLTSHFNFLSYFLSFQVCLSLIWP